VAAIEWQAADFEKLTGLPCAAVLPAEELALDTDCALTLFRIMQEALTNVIRHAQATKVEIRLQTKGNHVELEIEDDGRGFEPDSIERSKAMGVLGMSERAAVFGGDVAILSAPGKGATVRVRIPGRPVRSGGQP
jgi:signal transduction histidine kinase